MNIDIFNKVPDGLLDIQPPGLYTLLNNPTLIHLSGQRPETVFVSVLLHGNETTGFNAIQRLLKAYQDKPLPRHLSIFIGNISAARLGQRRLPKQPDYNRVWPGGEDGDCPEAKLMQHVWDEMRQRDLFASIDIHNNTGRNPHYACINRLDAEFLHLARLFSRTVVYFTKPSGVQSLAFCQLCPAVTVECGQSGKQHGVDHAREYVDAVLHLNEWPSHEVALQDVDIFHTVGIMKIPETLAIGFGEEQADICFAADFDHLNFCELPAGTAFARCQRQLPLQVCNEAGEDVAAEYFTCEQGELRTRQNFMPSMLTLDKTIIRQDCLGYVMERLRLSGT